MMAIKIILNYFVVSLGASMIGSLFASLIVSCGHSDVSLSDIRWVYFHLATLSFIIIFCFSLFGLIPLEIAAIHFKGKMGKIKWFLRGPLIGGAAGAATLGIIGGGVGMIYGVCFEMCYRFGDELRVKK